MIATIPKFGLRKDLDGLATKEFGSYVTVNTFTIDNKRISMSAPQFAKLAEIAPIYELKGKFVTGLRSLYSCPSGKEPGVRKTVDIR